MDPTQREMIAKLLQQRGPDYGPMAPKPGQPLTDLPDLGFGPMTPSTRQGLPNDTLSQGPPTTAEAMGRALMEYGPIPAKMAAGIAMQPVTAGEAVGTALSAQSIANWTDAGVQSAMMVPTFGGIKAAAGIAGAGLAGLAGREVLSPDSANAQATDAELLKSRMGEIDARQREIDAGIAANIANKKLSRAQTEELNSAMRTEKDKLAAERTGLLDRIAGQSRADADAAQKAEADRVLAGKPFSQRHPDLAKVLMAATYPLAGVLGYGTANKVLGNVGGANTAAQMAKDPAEYALARATADKLSASAPYKVAGGAAAAAALPAEMQFLPDLIDYKLMPHDSEAYKDAQGKFSDPLGYLSSLAAPLIGGAIMAGAGAGKRWASGSERERTAAMKFIDSPEGQKAIQKADQARSASDKWRLAEQEQRLAAAGKIQRLGHSEATAAEQRRLELAALRGIGPDDLPDGVMPQVRANLGDGLAQKYPAPANPVPQPAGSSSQRSLPPPDAQGGNIPTTQNGGQVQLVLSDEVQQAIAKYLQQPPPPTQGGRFLLPPSNPGRWADEIAPTARQAITDHVAAGGNLAPRVGLSEPKLSQMIDGALPAPTKRPSASDVRERVGNMRKAIGPNPTPDELAKFFSDTPDSVWKGLRVPALAGAIGLGAASQQDIDPREIGRLLMMQQQGY